VIILIVSCLSCLNCFLHYSLLHGVLKGYTYFIIAIFRISILSLVFYYFCFKASKLIKKKKYKLNTLKFITILGVVCSASTGAYIDYYIIPYDLQGDGLLLCKTIFIMLEESVDIVITIIYIWVFYQIKKSIVSEERHGAI